MLPKQRSSGRVSVAWLCVALTLPATWAFAHLCNNIYRTPDRLIVKPEKPMATVAGSEEFRVFVQNNYPTLLNNIRLAAKLDTDDVDVSVTPDSVRRLKAGERTSFTVRLKQKPGAKSARHALSFSISADQLGFKPVVETPTETLRQFLRKEDNTSATIQAAESLIARGDPAGSTYLRKIVAARGDRDTRSRAIRAVGKGGDRSNISMLKPLLDEQDGFVKGNALLALGLLKDDPASFIMRMDDRDEFVAACAASGLALSGSNNRTALTRLSEGIKSGNVLVRIACGWALAARRDKGGIDALDNAFDTNNPMQRVMAGDALVNVAGRH